MRHPYIINLHCTFQTKTKLVYIFRCLPGAWLKTVLQKNKTLSEDQAKFYIAEIVLAVNALHQRDIICRDLRPETIFIDHEGHVCLADLMLARENVSQPASGANSFRGSLAYLAPDMLKRNGYGKALDWYMVGQLLYHLLVGSLPYYALSQQRMIENILSGPIKMPRSMSAQAADLVISLLHRNPLKRLGSGPSGAQEIMDHFFFANFDWDQLQYRVNHRFETNIANFDVFKFLPDFDAGQIDQIFEEPEVDAELEEIEGWYYVNPKKQNFKQTSK